MAEVQVRVVTLTWPLPRTKTLDKLARAVFSCAVCEKRFRTRIKLKEHVRRRCTKTYVAQGTLAGRPSVDEVIKDTLGIRAEENQEMGANVKALQEKQGAYRHDTNPSRICKTNTTEKKTLSCRSGSEDFRKVDSSEDPKEEQSHVCKICLRSFRRSTSLRIHVMTHRKEGPYSCKICSKKFRFGSSLRTHKSCHTVDGPHVCGKSFRHNSSLFRHKTTCFGLPNVVTEPEVPQRAAEGDQSLSACSNTEDEFVFVTEPPLNATDFRSKISSVCPVCKMDFASPSRLLVHLREFSGEEVYLCPTCDSVFTCVSVLKAHLAAHEGVKKHRCCFCTYTYSTVNELKEHMASSHAKSTAHFCGVCFMAFKKGHGVRRHLRSHVEKRPHRCEMCYGTVKQAETPRGFRQETATLPMQIPFDSLRKVGTPAEAPREYPSSGETS